MKPKTVFVLAVVLGALCLPGLSPVAQTPAPLVEITVPLVTSLNPAVRTPVATYEWQTLGGSADPVEVRWILAPTAEHNDDWNETENYVRNNPDAPEWSPWQPYRPPSTGTSWTSPLTDYGRYVFAVHGRDGSGNVDAEFTLDRNMRRILISRKTTGPILKVTGPYIDEIITSVTVTPVTEIDLSSGTPVNFCWEASGDVYGLPVTGYRYSWDLADPDDDDAWSMPFTPFGQQVVCSPARTFLTGVHVFYVEAIDYDGLKSRVPVKITYVPPVPAEQATWGKIKSLYVW
jgi:hypothetical protein